MPVQPQQLPQLQSFQVPNIAGGLATVEGIKQSRQMQELNRMKMEQMPEQFAREGEQLEINKSQLKMQQDKFRQTVEQADAKAKQEYFDKMAEHALKVGLRDSDAGEKLYNSVVDETGLGVKVKKGSFKYNEKEGTVSWKHVEDADGNVVAFSIDKDGNVTEKKITAKGKGLKTSTEDKTPTPVTWTTASKNVGNRFGKEDALGNIIITPELQGMNRIAQKKLVDLQQDGSVKPLDAVNKSEDFARNVEGRYWEYLDAAKNVSGRSEKQDAIEKVNKAYKAKYGYIPLRQR